LTIIVLTDVEILRVLRENMNTIPRSIRYSHSKPCYSEAFWWPFEEWRNLTGDRLLRKVSRWPPHVFYLRGWWALMKSDRPRCSGVFEALLLIRYLMEVIFARWRWKPMKNCSGRLHDGYYYRYWLLFWKIIGRWFNSARHTTGGIVADDIRINCWAISSDRNDLTILLGRPTLFGRRYFEWRYNSWYCWWFEGGDTNSVLTDAGAHDDYWHWLLNFNSMPVFILFYLYLVTLQFPGSVSTGIPFPTDSIIIYSADIIHWWPVIGILLVSIIPVVTY